jgi:hypothetical protein
VSEKVLFQMGFFVAVCGIVAFWILWESGYRRRWLQYRARNWQTLPGKFDEGEIVPMMGARSSVGYEVRLGYDYQADEDRPGTYNTPLLRNLLNRKRSGRMSPARR